MSSQAPASSSRCVSDPLSQRVSPGSSSKRRSPTRPASGPRAANTSRSLGAGQRLGGLRPADRRPAAAAAGHDVEVGYRPGRQAARCTAGRPGRRTDVDRVPPARGQRSPASARRPRSPSGSGRRRGRRRRHRAPSPPPSTPATGSRPCPPPRGRPRSRRCIPGRSATEPAGSPGFRRWRIAFTFDVDIALICIYLFGLSTAPADGGTKLERIDFLIRNATVATMEPGGAPTG